MTSKQTEAAPEFAHVQTDEIYIERANGLIKTVMEGGTGEGTTAKVVELLKKADALRAGTVDQRLASLLLEIGLNAPEKTILFPQEKMAEAVGASRSFVSTILNNWKREGLISSFGRKVKLESVSKLTKIAKG